MRTISPSGVAELREHIGLAPGMPLLEALQERFADTPALERFIEEVGIVTSLWNRIGD